MLTVALVGADGAGKSTVAARLVEELPYPVRRMYLGVSASSATHPLPSTRVVRWLGETTGRSRPSGGPPSILSPDAPPPRATPARTVKAALRTTNRIAEEAYQEAVSRWHRSRGRVVLYDRFYLADFYAHDLSGRAGLSWDRRVHAAFLRRCFAEPDLVVVLDAEPELLWSRKREGSLAELARRREEYLGYASTVAHAVRIPADQPLEDVIRAVADAIGDAISRTATSAIPSGAVDPHDTQTEAASA